jgi:hypothetical protein
MVCYIVFCKNKIEKKKYNNYINKTIMYCVCAKFDTDFISKGYAFNTYNEAKEWVDIMNKKYRKEYKRNTHWVGTK